MIYQISIIHILYILYILSNLYILYLYIYTRTRVGPFTRVGPLHV